MFHGLPRKFSVGVCHKRMIGLVIVSFISGGQSTLNGKKYYDWVSCMHCGNQMETRHLYASNKGK